MSRDARVVVLGHVDHGKSTLIGRLLYDTGSLPAARIEEIVASSRRRGLQTEWSFALDALQDERDQAVTIDTTRVWFRLGERRFAIIDAPGHEEFLANAMTGASDADAAILVVDAERGVEDQTRRHVYLLGLLSVPHVVVAVNKIDAVDDPARVLAAGDAARTALEAVGVTVNAIVPVSARDGDNVASRSARTPWYGGPSLTELLANVVPRRETAEREPLRLWVQDVYRRGDERIVAGTVRSGRVAVGDLLRISPSGKTARVAALRAWPADVPFAGPGDHAGVVFDTPVYVDRGDLLSHDEDVPVTVRSLHVRACWFDREPPHADETVRLRAGSADVSARIVGILEAIDPRTLQAAEHGIASRGTVYALALRTAVPIALDEDERCAIARQGVPIAAAHAVKLQPQGANVFASAHLINATARAQRNGHRGLVFWLTGLPGAGKTTIAMRVERELFRRGYHVYALDGDTLRTGLTSDVDFSDEGRRENIRRVAEVGKLLADAGTVALISLVSPAAADRARARAIVGEPFHEAYVAASVATCEARDPKNLYKRARAGEIIGFTGVDAPYDVPVEPDLVLDTERYDVEACVASAVEYVADAVRITASPASISRSV
ncbi:MAG: bifunctional enzyme CysN/CysC [Candidatus Eremiobacteraeota bacterium]|nr:bifunctional enzyme CysN/CysC [Candidatus Eremiobacteraeota bacterium]